MLWRRSKSVSIRLRVTCPDGQVVSVDNLDGNDGFTLSFECTRAMNAEPGEAVVVARNLPPDVLGVLEAAQARRVDDMDAILAGAAMQSAVVAEDGADALAAGMLIVEVEAGFDGHTSRVFRAIGARSKTDTDSDDITTVTTIRASENLDGALLGLPMASFSAGTYLFEVVDYLRQIAGLGPGNCTFQGLTSVIGPARLDYPYHVSGGQALAHLSSVLGLFTTLRWFIDDREMWVCAADNVGSPLGALPWVADGPPEEIEPIVGRAAKDDGGQVSLSCILCPRIRPGRLVTLTPGGLALASHGLSPAVAAIRRAQVPAGIYRCEEVRHAATTANGSALSSMRLRAVTNSTSPAAISELARLLLDLGLAPPEVADVGL